MKSIKLYIYDVATTCHHSRLVVSAHTGKVVECFICREHSHRKGGIFYPTSDWGWIEMWADELKRLIRLYHMQPTRVAYVPDYVLYDDEDEWGNTPYWKDEVFHVCKFQRGL